MTEAVKFMTEATKFMAAATLHAPRFAGIGRLFPDAGDLLFGFSQHLLRDQFIAKFGFAVLTTEAVEAMRPYSPILEIGAGSGYWAHELKRAGIDVVASDSGMWRRHGHWKVPWTKVERLGAVRAVAKYPGRTLLVVWPDYGKPWAANALAAYRGSTVIYVGEPRGCTADERFHDLLDERFRRERVVRIPQFPRLHDRMEIWRRARKKSACGKKASKPAVESLPQLIEALDDLPQMIETLDDIIEQIKKSDKKSRAIKKSRAKM